ncbi:tetratricopeptide repeat protein [Inquilinus limosus]|uniref:tetratricopeptide repeat protein n=1 Tax=Inquilinus limosus TaxID=171674 RepID=UPI0011982A74|nr:hypothetical protein [Inquilinus limosus]
MSSLERSPFQNLVRDRERRAGLEQLDIKRQQWFLVNDTASAEELVAAAISLNRSPDEPLLDAAAHILNDPLSRFGPRILARSILGFSNEEMRVGLPNEFELHELIRNSKKGLFRSPRDSLLITETALFQTMLGHGRKAKSLMRQAVAITPHNRYVLRSAIRLLVHIGEFEEALSLARNSPAAIDDPWILAAGLGAASAAGRSPIQFRRALQLLDDQRFRSFDLSELASAVGTVHLSAGDHKQARRRFRQSLVEPTENAIAQAEWAGRQDRLVFQNIDPEVFRTSFEAKAWSAYAQGDWRASLSATEGWIKIEPFNPGPFVHGSFVAIVLTDHLDLAIDIANRGLLSNPDDPGILNNLAVGLAYRGMVDQALSCLNVARRHPQSVENSIIWDATEGLIAFRRGDVNRGIESYKRAMDAAVQNRLPEVWLRAAAHLSKEIMRISRPMTMALIANVEAVVERMRKLGRAVPPDVMQLIDRVRLSEPEMELDDSALLGGVLAISDPEYGSKSAEE